MHKVIVMIDGENVKINVTRVFCARNPVTNQYSVCLMEADHKKQVRLFCQDEEAGMLVQKIREGKINDLTGYSAQWNHMI